MVGRVLGGRKLLTIGNTGEKSFEIQWDMPCPGVGQHYTHNPSSGTSRCPSAVLSVSLVPIICTPPSVARPLQSSSVHPRGPHRSPKVLCLLGGVVLVLVSAGQ